MPNTYNRTNDPDGNHPLETTVPPVDLPEGGEPPEGDEHVVGYQGTDYTYNPVADPVEHEADTEALGRKEYPRHDRYASEHTGLVPDRIIPGGITNAHPNFTVGDVVNTTPEAENPDIVGYDETGRAVLAEDAEDAVVSIPQSSTEETSQEAMEDAMPAGNAPAEEWREYAVAQGMAPETADEYGRNELRAMYTSGEPAGNASVDEWRAYAVSQGMDPAEAESMSRDQLRDHYA